MCVETFILIGELIGKRNFIILKIKMLLLQNINNFIRLTQIILKIKRQFTDKTKIILIF